MSAQLAVMSWAVLSQLVEQARLGQHAMTALDEVDQLDSIVRRAQQQLDRAVVVARQEGASWAAIGEQLGTTRQAAQQRFGK